MAGAIPRIGGNFGGSGFKNCILLGGLYEWFGFFGGSDLRMVAISGGDVRSKKFI